MPERLPRSWSNQALFQRFQNPLRNWCRPDLRGLGGWKENFPLLIVHPVDFNHFLPVREACLLEKSSPSQKREPNQRWNEPESKVFMVLTPSFWQVPNLYENFISSRDTDAESLSSSRAESKDGPTSPATTSPKVERPKIGHTVYVFGYNITEDILRKGFQHFGNIVNISMEIEKKYGIIL